MKRFFFLCLLAVSILPSGVHTAGFAIGTPCSTNSDCRSGDCEDSDLDQSKDDFCDCSSANSCSEEYGTVQGETWTCVDGSSATHNLDYCQSNKRGVVAPISGGQSSGFDILLDSSALQVDEIKNLINAPQPQIRIPGVNFTKPEDIEKLTTREADGNTYLHIPYIGEYIASVYRYAVILIAVIAVILIIVRGFQITTSGGDAGKIDEAKHGIMQAVVGITLAVGSYVILYTINPQLVSFKNLRVLYVPRLDLALEENDTVEYSSAISPDVIRPTWTSATYDCNKSYQPIGVMPASKVISYTCPVGVVGTIQSIPEMQDAVCRVGQILAAQGYGIEITSSYRPFSEQVRLWCVKGKAEYESTATRKSYYAVPGFSNHGHAVAIDAHLTKGGKRLYQNVTSKSQCDIDPEYVRILAEAFYQADDKFNRLTTEVWHFEYGTGGKDTVGKLFDLPRSCNR